MNTANFGDSITSSFINAWNIFVSYIPNIVGALIILIIGLLIGYGLGRLTRRLVAMTGIDHYLHDTEVGRQLRLPFSIAGVLGATVRWFIIIATLLAVANALQIPQLNVFITELLYYIPNVIAAILILAIGGIIAEILQGVVSTALAPSTMEGRYKALLRSTTRWSILVFAALAALVQLRIVPQLIEILFAGIVLAAALAVGLGAKDHVAGLIGEMRRSRQA